MLESLVGFGFCLISQEGFSFFTLVSRENWSGGGTPTRGQKGARFSVDRRDGGRDGGCGDGVASTEVARNAKNPSGSPK